MDYKVDLNKPMSPAYIFTRASNMAKNLPPSIQPDQQTEIRLYALAKQAKDGDNHDPKPDGTDPVALAKWDLWKAMERLDEETAARQYVMTFQSVLRASDQPEAKNMLAQLQALSAKASA